MDRRKVEKLKDKQWEEVCGINCLHKGDTFRMFEPDGELVTMNDGTTVFHAISEPYWSERYSEWSIDIGNLLN